MFFRKILCFFGFHDWKKKSSYWTPDSSFRDVAKYCTGCGKTKKEVEIVEKDGKGFVKTSPKGRYNVKDWD